MQIKYNVFRSTQHIFSLGYSLSFSMPTIRIITAAAVVEPTENEWKRAIFCVAADE